MNTILVTGYAKAPQGTPMHEMFKYSGVVLEIDPKTHKIVDVEISFITKLAQDFFNRLLVGMEFAENIEPIVKKIQEYYYAPSQQSIIVALKVAHQRYWDEVKPKNK